MIRPGGIMERGKLWRTAFNGNARLLEMNAAGLTEDLASRRPASGVAPAAWILGHLINTRRSILKMLGSTPPEDPVWGARYARGGSGASAHLTWAELLEVFGTIGQDLKTAIQNQDDWDRPTLNPALGIEQPLEQVLAFLYMHECYHLGQIGIIRKLHGLPGAI
jgi:uncharacterized damage-inducible protein DinB